MAAGDLRDSRGADRIRWVVLLVVCIVALAGVLLSPIILGMAFAGSKTDYSAIGDIGQAYGAASAAVSSVALVAVLISVFAQNRQFRAMRIQSLVETNDELVMLAMENPAYRQCWGSRVSPGHIGEDLFYYCSRVVKLWTDSWEQGKIDETLARDYLRKFFDSEVPRIFWEKYGDWHRRGPVRNRRDQFRAMADEEYLWALRGGPPSRSYEAYSPEGERFPMINRPWTGGWVTRKPGSVDDRG